MTFNVGDRVKVTLDDGEHNTVQGKVGVVVKPSPDNGLGYINVVLDDLDFTQSYMYDRNWVWLFAVDEIEKV